MFSRLICKISAIFFVFSTFTQFFYMMKPYLGIGNWVGAENVISVIFTIKICPFCFKKLDYVNKREKIGEYFNFSLKIFGGY